MWNLDYDDEDLENIKGELKLEPVLLMTAGPTNCSPRTLKALSMQTFVPLVDQNYNETAKRLVDEIKALTMYVFQTKNKLTFCEQNSAHGGIETIFTNLVDPGETVLVATAGLWGERAVLMAKNYGLNVVRIPYPPRDVLSFDQLEAEIIKHKPVLLFTTQGETSTGICQPLEGLGEICHRYNCLLAVDAVITFGGVPLYVDRWELDAVVAASQKAVAAPPGFTFLTFSDRAVKRMERKKVNPPFYLNAKLVGNCWRCWNDGPAGFHYTWNSNMMCAVREALTQILEEGLLNSWKRHKENAERLWKGLEKLNLKLWVPKEENRLHTVTSVILPEGIQWQKLCKYTFEKHQVDFSFGIGPTYGKCIRIGVIGYNARPEMVDKALEVLADALENYPNYADEYTITGHFSEHLSSRIMEIQPPQCLKKRLTFPHKLLMGPGPSNCSPRVLHALSLPVLGHMHQETFQIMDEIKEGIKYIFQTRNDLTLAVSAAGHGGMEAVLCNLVEPGDKVLVAVSGLWGIRASGMAESYGATVVRLKSNLGHNFPLRDIEAAIASERPALLFIVQGESSVGLYQPLEDLGKLCHKYNCLLAVDTVASIGAVPFFMDKWEIDAVYTGSQKVIGAPPGLAPISFSSRAQRKIFQRKTKPLVFYWDMTFLGEYWDCFNRPRTYHHTISSNLICGLREALAIITEEGLENVIERHRRCAKQLYDGLKNLGLDVFIEDPKSRLPTVTAIKIPPGIEWKEISNYAMQRYHLEIAGGLGPTEGKIGRIGIMGYNAYPENVDFVLQVLKEALQNKSKL